MKTRKIKSRSCLLATSPQPEARGAHLVEGGSAEGLQGSPSLQRPPPPGWPCVQWSLSLDMLG